MPSISRASCVQGSPFSVATAESVVFRIPSISSVAGRGMRRTSSKRRISAVSSDESRLVAAMTRPSPRYPSSISSRALVIRVASPTSFLSVRDRARVSHSSRKSAHGVASAASKTLRRLECVSPKYEDSSVSKRTLSKGSPMFQARRSDPRLLPQPGGPCRRTRRRGCRP